MSRLTRAMEVEDDRTLVKDRCFRRVQILWLYVALKRSATKGDDATSLIMNRNDHPVTKAIVRNGNVIACNKQTRLDHVFNRNALRAQVLLQSEAVGCC